MSGRSGRRRGSQKPGTACGAASTAGRAGVWATAAPLPKIAASADAIDSPASHMRAGRCSLTLVNGTMRCGIAGNILRNFTAL